ncbi:hypothetical protein LZ578_11890 [Jeotgalibaca sp. MA1X17-3]|uniref:hypothetical protein n=1 Tax=Jeotgalibaca sp. MA1X17-3 TaxID=2908211 RepID=UPI001F3ECF3A|nr:hypothetical protein [Jeotgalibaca sp. MA1X17-3]UJF15637.1 hypothetical protein LZ578_11890 [Jeotgalibaca sp. MA1X17-3]
MKKLLFISMASFVLGACATDTTTEDETTSSEAAVSEFMSTESSIVEESATVVESEEIEADEGTTDADLEDVSDSELEGAEKVSEYAEYEELDAQDIFNPSDYDGHLVTDNQGTRVFLFSDGDNQMYKTIFVKNNNRLKVIDLQADQMVYNEQIN